MKELSIKEKAKRYDEAIEKGKQIQNTPYTAHWDIMKEVAEHLLPELAESENERIRKALKRAIAVALDYSYFDKDTADNCLAWLEKQGEQKPTDKVEPLDIYKGLTDFERTLADICIGWIGEELGWKQYIKDNANILLKIAIKMFNSVQDVPFEQNPAWSEEDEVRINRIVACLENLKVADDDILLKDVDWLKSLKDRVQPKQELSKEGTRLLDNCISLIEDIPGTEEEQNWLKPLRPQNKYAYNPYKKVVESIAEMCKHYDKASYSGLRDFYNNVKVKCKDAKEYDSLFPQNRWKPSDEQIKALNYVVNLMASSESPKENDYYYNVFKDLREQLKKLREE